MKKGNLILLVVLTTVLFTACKNEKASKAMDKAKGAVENVVDETQEAVAEAGEKLEDIAVDMTTDSEPNSIGSDELEELKKAEAEAARTPKVSKEKGTRPESVPKPSTSSKSSSSPKPKKPSATSKPTGSSKPTKPKVTSLPQAEGSNTGSSSGSNSSAGSNTKETKTKVEEVGSAIEEAVEEVKDETPVPTNSTPGKEIKEVKDKPTGAPTQPTKVGKIEKPGGTGGSTSTNMNTGAAEFSHTAFNTLLKKFVSSAGVVNYSQLKASSRSLDGYCKKISENPPQDSWTKNEKLAYWLNAYNAYTLKLIADNYPVNSITDLHGGKPWELSQLTM